MGSARPRGSSELAGNRDIALGLADDLMAEILVTSYSDPSGAGLSVWKPGEAAAHEFPTTSTTSTAARKPPEAANGTIIPDRTGYRQRVVVERVVPATPTQATPGTDQISAKRIERRSNSTTSCWQNIMR